MSYFEILDVEPCPKSEARTAGFKLLCRHDQSSLVGSKCIIRGLFCLKDVRVMISDLYKLERGSFDGRRGVQTAEIMAKLK